MAALDKLVNKSSTAGSLPRPIVDIPFLESKLIESLTGVLTIDRDTDKTISNRYGKSQTFGKDLPAINDKGISVDTEVLTFPALGNLSGNDFTFTLDLSNVTLPASGTVTLIKWANESTSLTSVTLDSTGQVIVTINGVVSASVRPPSADGEYAFIYEHSTRRVSIYHDDRQLASAVGSEQNTPDVSEDAVVTILGDGLQASAKHVRMYDVALDSNQARAV